MRKVIFIKEHKQYKIGKVEQFSNNVAWGLVENGIADYYIETQKTNFGETKAIKYKKRNNFR